MAVKYSNYYDSSTDGQARTKTRVKIDYDGTSATATLLYTRTNSWYTAVSGATFSFGGASTTYSISNTGPVNDLVVASVKFTISTSGGTYSGYSSKTVNGDHNYFGGEWSVTLPAQATPPATATLIGTAFSTYAAIAFGCSNFGTIGGQTAVGTCLLSQPSTTTENPEVSSTSNAYNWTSTVGATARTTYFYPTKPGTYYFRARGYNSELYGPYSASLKLVFNNVSPSTPAVAGSTTGQTSNKISYAISSYGLPNSGILYLYGGTSPNPTTQLTYTSSTSGTYTHTGLEPGTVYYYRARAKNTNGDWSNWSSDFTIRTRYASPTNITATLNRNRPDYLASATIAVGSWGAGSTEGSYAILNSSKNVVATSTQPTINWTPTVTNTNTLSCGVVTWYARAINNHDEYTDSPAYYFATPSAPITSYIGHIGVNPFMTRTSTVTYGGGATNSTSADTSNVVEWITQKTRLSDNTTENRVQAVNSKTYSTDYLMSDFTTGSNYRFAVTAINDVGGRATTTSQTYYCPSGVGGAVSEIHPDGAIIKATATGAGGMGTTTEGTLSCYQLSYGTSSTSLTKTTKIQTDPYFEIEDLTPGVTYYYRVTAWNSLGLSGQSPVQNFTTGGRYLPQVRSFTFNALNPGADIVATIGRTGGVSQNELTINKLVLETRPVGTTTWVERKTATGLSLKANNTYTFKNAWTDYFPEAGDQEMRITAYNQYDHGSRIFTLIAPATPTITTPGFGTTSPIQITLNATTTAGTARLTVLSLVLKGEGLDVTKNETVNIPSGATVTSTIVSPNYLLFNTTYTGYVTAKDAIGLWNEMPNGVRLTTPKRVSWYLVTDNNQRASVTREGSASFRSGSLSRSVSDEVYYVVGSSLGYHSEKGFNFKNKRLTFISQPLFYRPECVASLTLSNNRRLAYDYDSKADTYKFGIWNGNNIVTTFFDGEKWLMDHYDFSKTTSITITGVTYNGRGINASSAFSTTIVEEQHDW